MNLYGTKERVCPLVPRGAPAILPAVDFAARKTVHRQGGLLCDLCD